jgi:ornithine cyclodeaminase/alanine dehydrogenase-like protein (mu-crystallin family)
MLVLRRNEVDELLSPEASFDVMTEVFGAMARGQVSMPPRIFVESEDHDGSVGFMPALVVPGESMGLKAVALFHQNPKRFNLPTILGSMLLLDARNGQTLALMDAGPLTAKRTAAVSALATDHLATEGATDAGFIGAGVQARSHAVALKAIRPITRIKAFSRTSAHAEEFAQWASQELGLEARAVDTAEEAAAGSDIVTCATPATSPILEGSWLESGTHLNVIGSGPAREVDGETYRRAGKVVVDSREHSLGEARDLVTYLEQGILTEADIHAELGELVTGAKPGRENDEEITLFRSVGLAVEDVAAARYVFDAATRLDRGVKVEFP